MKDDESFIFQERLFCEVFWKFKHMYKGEIEKVFNAEFNSTFWNPQARGIGEVRKFFIFFIFELYYEIWKISTVFYKGLF